MYRNREEQHCTSTSRSTLKRKWRDNRTIDSLISKLPFSLPLQSRVEAIFAHEQLMNDKVMETVVRGIVDIVEIVKKADPNKLVSTLVSNAIVGRFNLAWMLIKKYKSQPRTDPIPSSHSAFLPDPSQPEDICLFKLTLYSVRNLIRLFEKSLAACAEAGFSDTIQTQKKKKNDKGEEITIEQKIKK